MIESTNQASKSIRVWFLAMSVFGSGCAHQLSTQDQHTTPPTLTSWLPGKYSEVANSTTASVTPDFWWRSLGSSQLNEFLDLGLRENFDIKTAELRVAQARTQLKMTETSRYPMLNLTASNRLQQNAANSSQTIPSSIRDDQFQLGLIMNYEIDFFGRRELGVESAKQILVANEFVKQGLELSLAGDIATLYFQAVALNERLEVTRNHLSTVSKVTGELERRMVLGDATLLMVSQQRIMQKSMESQKSDLTLQRERILNLLSALLGQPPGRIQISSSRLPLAPALGDVGLPSELLCRRPDIRQAEALLNAAQADVGIARAQLYPSFNMALQTGRTSTILSALTSPQSLFFQINAQLVQTLFDNGNKAMGVDLSMNRQLELTHRYAYTVLTALREVENGLISVAYTSQKVNALQDARLEATALAALSSRVVELGGIDFVQLLQIQEAVYSAESSAIIGRLDLLQAWIDLYKSLGGGLKIEANTCPGGKRLNSISNITSQGATKQSILNGAPLP